MNRKCKSKHKK